MAPKAGIWNYEGDDDSAIEGTERKLGAITRKRLLRTFLSCLASKEYRTWINKQHTHTHTHYEG